MWLLILITLENKLKDLIFIKKICFVSFWMMSAINPTMNWDNNVENAAPDIPNKGINIKFRRILNRAPMIVLCKLKICLFSTINHLLLATPRNTKTDAQTWIVSVELAARYASPKRIFTTDSDRNVIGKAIPIESHSIRSNRCCNFL